MSASMNRSPAGDASAFEEKVTPPSDNLPPPDEGVFFNSKTRIEFAEILKGPELIRAGMRENLYRAVNEKRLPVFQRNEILLTAAHINNHDTDHQDRDGSIAKKLFEAFPDKLDQSMLEPVLVASMVHDMQYIEAARRYAIQQLNCIRETWNEVEDMRSLRETVVLRPLVDSRTKWLTFVQKLEYLESNDAISDVRDLWEDGSFPSQIGKKELDPHAELGMAMIESWYDDSELEYVFAEWTPEQKRVAALSIRDHSNGTDYNPFTVPQEAKVLRLADKLDNTYHRVPTWMLNERSLMDPNSCHRYVPTAIRSLDIDIDRENKVFTVEYGVDPSQVEILMHANGVNDFSYDKDRFIREFRSAYGKSMTVAAEVAYGLFAEGEEFYSATATFRVCLRFPDGSEDVHIYEPQTAPPTFG